MIKTLSPYNLSIPFVAPISDLTCTSYTLELFVWNGDKLTPPTSPTYLMTKTNPTASTGNDKIDIARIISDFINFTPNDTTTTELIDGDNQYWVKYQIYYETADSDDFVPNYVTTELMLKGYGYGMEGENAQPPANKILLTGTEFKVNRNGFFVFPFLIEESEIPPLTLTINSVVLDGIVDCELDYTPSRAVDYVTLRYRETGLDWNVYGNFYINPFMFTLPSPEISGTYTYDVQIYRYDEFLEEIVYSNIVEVTQIII